MKEVLSVVEKLIAKDDSTKFILCSRYNDYVESVSLKLPNLKPSQSFCISTQVGCPVGCKFCASATRELYRNLEDIEIIEELELLLKTIPDTKKFRLALMGVGEPLLNYNNVISAINYILKKYSKRCRKIFLSTIGIPGVLKRIIEDFRNVDVFALQISLNFSLDSKRSYYMPFTAFYSLKELIESCKHYIESTHKKITFSYLMLDRINDSKRDFENLKKLLLPIKDFCILKLSIYNPIGRIEFNPSSYSRMEDFKWRLLQSGYSVRIFRSNGISISGGCGQLAARKYK